MKRAILLPQYSDVKPFSPPEGITSVRIDRATSLRADDSCSGSSFYAAFLDGTAPLNSCSQMKESPQNFIQKLFGIGGSKQPVATPPVTTTAAPGAPITRTVPVAPSNTPAPTNPEPTPQKKKNIFQKIFRREEATKTKNNPTNNPRSNSHTTGRHPRQSEAPLDSSS